MPLESTNHNYILVLDLGTTNLKCHVFTKHLKLKHKKYTKVSVQISGTDNEFVEIDHNHLWKLIHCIVPECLHEAGINIKQVASIGISCSRGSFITWNRHSGKPYHNFISWKDTRAKIEVESLNNSVVFKLFKCIAALLYWVTRSPRFLTASLLEFNNVQVTCKLLWLLKNNSSLKRAVQNGDAMFGTLDTWLLYRLTKGRTYCTDVSMASSTGMYDPYVQDWSLLMKFVSFSTLLMPNVCDTAGYHFGEVDAAVWGVSVAITCSIADQAAALYGSRCWQPGEVKITLGTGAFLDVNVGSRATASRSSLYPLICWKYGGQLAYALEAACHDCGTVIDWLIESGSCESIEELTALVNSIHDTKGVIFVPTFFGLQTTVNDSTIPTGFVGVENTTEKKYLVKAAIEGIIFRLYEVYKLYEEEVFLASRCPIKVNGGVSNNDYICQSLANICNRTVQRPYDTEMSILGVLLLTCQVIGECSLEAIDNKYESCKTFEPNWVDGCKLRCKFIEWQRTASKLTR